MAIQRKYFGTDGVRGRVGKSPLTADFALKLANAAARALIPEGGTVLIGKDTRLSGYMFESALEAGFVAAGVNVMLIGPLPTPGVAYMARHLKCDLSVVISASHNAFNDNGIKFFDKNGEKLSDEMEEKIESLVDGEPVTRDSQSLGRATRVDEMRIEYEKFCASVAPKSDLLKGMKIVVDSANGAGYKVAPNVFTALGADVVSVGASPNGKNINDGCGATAPEFLQMNVKGTNADAGIALDGDGDRLIMVDRDGEIIDGDKIVYMLALAHKKAGTLKGPVVGTVMSNMGVELALKKEGIEFLRAKVGDRHIMELLRKNGGILGGEPSGHILTLDRTTTGDAIIAAVQALSVAVSAGKGLKELSSEVTLFPQISVSVPLKKPSTVEEVSGLSGAVTRIEKECAGKGRVVVRPSGTEPVMRVMVEHENADDANRYVKELSDIVRSAQ